MSLLHKLCLELYYDFHSSRWAHLSIKRVITMRSEQADAYVNGVLAYDEAWMLKYSAQAIFNELSEIVATNGTIDVAG